MAKYGLGFALIPALMLIAGCANQQHPDAQVKENKAAAEETRKDIGSIDDARCQAFGYQPGSTGYIQCRKDFDSQRTHMGIKE